MQQGRKGPGGEVLQARSNQQHFKASAQMLGGCAQLQPAGSQHQFVLQSGAFAGVPAPLAHRGLVTHDSPTTAFGD